MSASFLVDLGEWEKRGGDARTEILVRPPKGHDVRAYIASTIKDMRGVGWKRVTPPGAPRYVKNDG